jgi:multiple antibiotic resistance protein
VLSELLDALLTLSALFFVVDPIGVLPIFVSITPGDPPAKRRAMAKKACLVAGGLLLAFALAGGALFRLLGVTLPAFKVAGGIALLLNGIDMLRGQAATPLKTSPAEQAEGVASEDVAVFPLAMPLLAGPGSIATVMVMMGRATGPIAVGGVIFAVLATMAASYLILRTAEYTDRWMSTTVKTIIVRVMGLLLAGIAVQFMLEGTIEALRQLGALAALPIGDR